VAFIIIKHLIKNKPRSKTLNDTQDQNSSPDSLEYKQTVQCGYCGTRIPLAGAFKTGEHYFCDESHANSKKS